MPQGQDQQCRMQFNTCASCNKNSISPVSPEMISRYTEDYPGNIFRKVFYVEIYCEQCGGSEIRRRFIYLYKEPIIDKDKSDL